jgi:hypothetical protein
VAADPALIRVICDAVVAKIKDIWLDATGAPLGDTDAVQRCYLPDVSRAKDISNRLVFVYPLSYGQETEGGSRDEDPYKYAVGVDIWDRYTGAEVPPPVDWVDCCVDFVSCLEVVLGEPRVAIFPQTELANLYADTTNVAYVYDPERMRQDNLFLSSLELGYRMDV